MTNSIRTNLRLRTRSLAAAAALVALGAGTAIPAIATAGEPAPTKVTIVPENDGFYGYVKSPKENKCANGRKVILLKQLGESQNPARRPEDRHRHRPGQRRRLHVVHRQHRPQKGRFYARAKKTPDCQADNSKSVKMTN